LELRRIAAVLIAQGVRATILLTHDDHQLISNQEVMRKYDCIMQSLF
jgi:hypothetical protein